MVFVLIGILVEYLWAQQKNKFGERISFKDFSQIKPILPEEILNIGQGNYKEFTDPDGKLKMKYPSDWLEIKDEKFLEGTIPKEWAEKYNLQTLFFAQGIKTNMTGQIIVNEGNFDIPVEEIIEEMKKSSRAKEWNMEVVSSDIGKGIFEAKYQKPAHYDLHSKEKILFGGQKENVKKVYLIAYIVFDKDWDKFQEEADEIMDSIQLIDQNVVY